ncbi:MAG TPA: NfeD family protein [Candidatus Binatia bacterium]|jgi:membrane protein implicated in regulation of membrane protease activity|nr:NfeD family protein [Candidatus Binatia bacterium]
MSWAIFYLVCFLIGVTLSVLSFVGGTLHLPHVHVHVPHSHIPHATGHLATRQGGQTAEMPFFNFATVTAFLAWFGGSGYLLTRYSAFTVTVIMLIAVVVGLLGAAFIFLFLVKFLMKHDRELDPADFDRVGVLGRVISPIREGGTGEIIFSQAGTRQTCGARSESGDALPKDTEIVVTRYEHGIAYVRKWDEMSA